MRSSPTTRALAATGAVVSAAAVVVAVVATVWVMPAGVVTVVAGQTPAAGAPGQVIPPTEFVTDITISEDALSVVERSLETLFLDGVRRFDWAQVAESLTEEFGGAFPGAEEGRLVDDPTLSIRRYGSTDRAWLDRSDFVEVLRRQTETWTSVERASWQTFEFLLEPTHDRAFLKGHLQLGGPDPTGARSLMDLTVDARVVGAGPDRWEFERFVVVEGTSVHNPFPPFRDITDAAGFHFNRSDINRDLRQDIVDTRSSLIDSSLSIVDWDDDGFWDVIATESMNRSVLFLNDGKGGFTRGTLPFDDPRLIPAQVLFVDLDGDGVEELVGNRVLYRDGQGSIGIYTRPDGAWLFLPNALEFDNPLDTRRTDAQPMTAGDVNGDGLLDLVITSHGTHSGSIASTPRTGRRPCCSSTTATCVSPRSPMAEVSQGPVIPTWSTSSISIAMATSICSRATTTDTTSCGTTRATADSGSWTSIRSRATRATRWGSPSVTGTTAVGGACTCRTCTRMPGPAWFA